MKNLCAKISFGVFLAAFGSFNLPATSALAEQSAKGAIVVELYTSQGCSSCPPAEAYMHDLAKRDDVIALEFHVDYWDYIGWKDPFADPAYTERQRRYVRHFGERYVYTPQMIIDGAAHAVGSRRHDVERAIETARAKRASETPDILIQHKDGGIEVTIPASAQIKGSYDINLVSFDGSHETEVTRGENRGRQLKNARVVRALTPIGRWRGDEVTHVIARENIPGNGGCAILIQESATGRVLTASQLLFSNS